MDDVTPNSIIPGYDDWSNHARLGKDDVTASFSSNSESGLDEDVDQFGPGDRGYAGHSSSRRFSIKKGIGTLSIL